ncbi:hypothetical protein FE257_009338 [Aspergillus nanangensis]|uniref:Pyroglutamyl peptidase type I n=1 Tax=Aspergillus nanangensis TaxID=2582783 RepID=A0AAD4GU34_ASPNN|nr:hypothetical protein FE257_009338 [Aspergillus nanangensis]
MGDYGPGVMSSKTQVAGDPPVPLADPDEISVLVTGFGPFKTNLVNASYLIASSLPPSLEFPSNVSTTAEGTPTPRRVSIHVHPAPVPVAYSTVQSEIPVILDNYVKTHGGRRPDIVIHMGIAATRSYYSVEMQAHRDSYHMSDIRGKSGYEDGERLWRELELPPVLRAGPATSQGGVSEKQLVCSRPPDDDFLRTWRSFVVPGSDIRISPDAGRYLCEFIFYQSLAVAFQGGHDRNVAFFHVPSSCNEDTIQKGKGVAIALIKALVECWLDRRS